MIRLGVPKGRLWERSLGLLEDIGYSRLDFRRRYAVRHPSLPLEAVALKIQDIPTALTEGLIDLAVVSDEWLLESGLEIGAGIPLCWYHVHIDVLAPHGITGTTAGAAPVTVATPYQFLTTRLLTNCSTLFSVQAVAGAVEAYPGRFTDLAVDCIETGETARANGLVSVQELARCDVRYLRGPSADGDDPAVLRVEAAVRRAAVDPECTWAGLPTSNGQPK